MTPEELLNMLVGILSADSRLKYVQIVGLEDGKPTTESEILFTVETEDDSFDFAIAVEGV